MRGEIARAEAAGLVPETAPLGSGDAADRLARHVQAIVEQAVGRLTDADSLDEARALVADLLALLAQRTEIGRDEVPTDPLTVLTALAARRPDGKPEHVGRPLTPLSDTTLLTNSPGEPALGFELQAEIDSAESIDAVVAFIRWTGIRPLISALRRHCERGRRLRILTTTYTGTTEQAALDALRDAGAEIRVSYDLSNTRLHAKAWLFNRHREYSTAYVGSSNLTHSAQVTGLEWNVRLSGVRNPDAIAKVAAVFESYWQGGDFVDYDPAEFVARTGKTYESEVLLSPLEVVLRPFQERLLEEIGLARARDHHRNLLVAATGTGKTVMAAVDYARLRGRMPRSRLLFVAHRNEILEQSVRLFREVLRDPTFGELWVGGRRPEDFDHVFASIQSLKNVSDSLDPEHYDVVIVDEFHHAAAATYQRLLERLRPAELLGLTATPERADGLSVLSYFDGRIAAELRIWDAIDQQYLVPFAYYGVHDGTDLSEIPWRRGQGYDVAALEGVFTADHIWANRVIEQVRRYVGDLSRMRAIGFCVSVRHAEFMAARFSAAGIPSAALSAASGLDERRSALRALGDGELAALFAVDIFNEGIDVPAVDTLLMLRPTESATLFLQQLGRGLRRDATKSICTVLDFVGQHRREFRFDQRLRALLGGSRAEIQKQVEQDFPFLPAGCTFELDRIAKEVVLDSLKNALPSRWRDRVEELRAQGDVSLRSYLDGSGRDLEDLYSNGRSWTELRRAVGFSAAPEGPEEQALLRAMARLLHVDDQERLRSYVTLLRGPAPPDIEMAGPTARRRLRMLVDSLFTDRPVLADALQRLWAHPAVVAELVELFEVLEERVSHLGEPVTFQPDVPLRLHARYTRGEILGALSPDPERPSRPWREGVLWEPALGVDCFAFTLDKSSGSFSPTTRYRDYAISASLIHWESQSGTSVESPTARRYVAHKQLGTHVLLFARMRQGDAFWCLGEADYVSHEGSRPVAIVWKLRSPLPGDLYASFAAVAA